MTGLLKKLYLSCGARSFPSSDDDDDELPECGRIRVCVGKEEELMIKMEVEANSLRMSVEQYGYSYKGALRIYTMRDRSVPITEGDVGPLRSLHGPPRSHLQIPLHQQPLMPFVLNIYICTTVIWKDHLFFVWFFFFFFSLFYITWGFVLFLFIIYSILFCNPPNWK
ncbi:hypothetical protein QJS04_geneDACA001410 [Acorus gramineus]|uniref:Uncharacterized protein n=1 Tax=Acorus gramineus TaxID=55184 RepID=A0AAV9A613_ACOGR|nr:hypothetical protein QJS04_geneDACA001410 [Acorus gramineus]